MSTASRRRNAARAAGDGRSRAKRSEPVPVAGSAVLGWPGGAAGSLARVVSGRGGTRRVAGGLGTSTCTVPRVGVDRHRCTVRRSVGCYLTRGGGHRRVHPATGGADALAPPVELSGRWVGHAGPVRSPV